jgi:hypothetical protein
MQPCWVCSVLFHGVTVASVGTLDALYPLWLHFVVFAVAAAFVWSAGTRLARHADEVSRITGFS